MAADVLLTDVCERMGGRSLELSEFQRGAMIS